MFKQWLIDIDTRLKSIGFELHFISSFESKYYHKPVTKYDYGNGKIESIGKVLIVRVSNHHIPIDPDGSLRGYYDYELIFDQLEEDTEEVFDSLKSYS